MTIAEGLLAEFEQELLATRRCLERVPEDKLGWQPHAKSMTLGQLAIHTATTPSGVLEMVLKDDVPLPSWEGAPPTVTTKAELLKAVEDGAEYVRAELPKVDDVRMLAEWRVLKGDQPVICLPRVAFIRSIMFNHWYHHRGQLTVYLRECGVEVPSVYGPSADEVPDFLK